MNKDEEMMLLELFSNLKNTHKFLLYIKDKLQMLIKKPSTVKGCTVETDRCVQ